MPGYKVIVMGASTGGVPALQQVIGILPSEFPAAVLLVMHTSPESPGLLPQVLGRGAALPVRHAVDGEEILPRHVYVAPPDRHLLVQGERLRVWRGPRENRNRPA